MVPAVIGAVGKTKVEHRAIATSCDHGYYMFAVLHFSLEDAWIKENLTISTSEKTV